MVAANEVCDLPGVFQINGILAHADGKGFDRFRGFLGSYGTDKGGIQTAGKEKTNLSICD